MKELDADIALVSETWMSRRDEELVEDLEHRTGYVLIRKDRQSDRPAGGVAICFKKNAIEMTQIRLPMSSFEIVAAIGRRTGQRRKVAVLALYIPPSYNAEENRRFLAYLNDCLIIIKSRYNDPYVFIGGDVNKRRLNAALCHYPGVKRINTAATREYNVFDQLFPTSLMPLWTVE